MDNLTSERLSICKSCEYFKPLLSRCSLCGCVMFLKSKIKSAKCPKGKW